MTRVGWAIATCAATLGAIQSAFFHPVPRLIWNASASEALKGMFEHDRSAARGEMASRKLIVFRHASALGNASASELFKRVKTWRLFKGERCEPGDDRLDNAPPARSFSDYAITIDGEKLPSGLEIIERL